MKKIQTTLQLLTLVFFTVLSVNSQAEEWVEKKYEIKGSWDVVMRDGKTFITFDEKFKTKNGPDLKIFLSNLSMDQVNGKNVISSSVLVSPLKSSKGAQEYEIPASLNIDDFSSLLIHCEKYSVLWGGGSLKYKM